MSGTQNRRPRTRGGHVHSGRNIRRDGTFHETGSRSSGDTIAHTPPSVRRGASQEFTTPNSADVAGQTPTLGKRYFCGRHTIVRGGGRVGNNSRTSDDDALAVNDDDSGDDNDHVDDDSGDDNDPSMRESVEPRDTSNRKWIRRVGRKFGDGKVHRSVKPILERNFDGAWVTFKKVPKDALDRMFGCFRTLWKWDPQDDESIYEGFVNVLKDRYRNILGEWRIESKEKAKNAGHDIDDDEENFEITCDYPPDIVPLETWQDMCKVWRTPQWLKRSKVGKNNRKDKNSGNYLPRHTGGSMGFDERRINLEKSGKGEFSFVFVDTHATKECKQKLSAKDIDVDDVTELEFCTERSKTSYVAYKNQLERLYESNPDQHRGDNLAVWESVQPNTRVGRMFGIGSSDPHFVVVGTPSTACGSKSYLDSRQSQEVQDVKFQLEKEQMFRQELENRLQQLEHERVEREEREQRERAEREEKEQRERDERDQREQQMQNKLDEIMRKFNSNT